MCEQGNQGPETKPGTASEPWCLCPCPDRVLGHCHRQSCDQGIAWHGNSSTAILQSGDWCHCPAPSLLLGSVKLIAMRPKPRAESTGEHLPFPGVLSGKHLAQGTPITSSNLLSWYAELRSSPRSDNVLLQPFLTIQFSP